jgi:hypothetical protein
MEFANTWTGGGYNNSATRSWADNGDKAATSSYLSSVSAQAVNSASIDPATVSAQASLTSDQQWNCSAPSGFTDVVFEGAQDGIAVCDEQFGGENGGSDWVQCGYATSSTSDPSAGYDNVVVSP